MPPFVVLFIWKAAAAGRLLGFWFKPGYGCEDVPFFASPGYTRTKPAEKPKLGPLLPVIDAILEADQSAPLKQRHTAKRIFERLRDEHGFAGGYTVVKDHVRICRARGRETFVPLSHPPGQAQVDFGEAVAIIGGVRQKIRFFCMDLPQLDACFVKGYPRETTEAFLDGHVSAFAFFGGADRDGGEVIPRTPASAPPKRPIGVRTASQMKASVNFSLASERRDQCERCGSGALWSITAPPAAKRETCQQCTRAENWHDCLSDFISSRGGPIDVSSSIWQLPNTVHRWRQIPRAHALRRSRCS